MFISLIFLALKLIYIIVKELPVKNACDLLASCKKNYNYSLYAFIKKCFYIISVNIS
jgi:hypothetical protein